MAESDLFTNIKTVYSRMARAALKAERDLTGVRLVAVTKQVTAEMVCAGVDCGLREFGESRVQVAGQKIPVVRAESVGADLVWHLIGPLQKNKSKKAVGLFDLIHSVDSVELASAINSHAAEIGKVQRVLLEVKLSPEETKHGIGGEGVIGFLRAVQGMRHLKVEGLMTVPPYFDDPQEARPYFRKLREIRDTAIASGFDLKDLSMGMSHDFEVAIEEGATIVRVGTALFGERKKEAA